MTQLDAARKPTSEGEITPLAPWLVPGGLLIGGLLGIALSVTTFGTSWSGNITNVVAPDQTIGAAGALVLPGDSFVPVPAHGRKSFAFGYLEFDWDPNAPGGVPGFDSWPS